jgi:hypothetical protein
VYGNALALDAVFAAFEAEVGGTPLVFNGDFNWFNVDPVLFQRLNEPVLCWPATSGNVETELEASGSAARSGHDPVCERMLLLVGNTRTKGEWWSSVFPKSERNRAEIQGGECTPRLQMASWWSAIK